jgi:hypothetical protein
MAATTSATGSASRAPALVAIRAAHSAVFLVELGSILWLVATGLTGRRDRSVGVAATLVAGEAAVFVLNRGVCPLTPLAERHGASKGGVSDIFLPDRLARTIPIWSTALIALGAVLHVRALLTARRGGIGPVTHLQRACHEYSPQVST